MEAAFRLGVKSVTGCLWEEEICGAATEFGEAIVRVTEEGRSEVENEEKADEGAERRVEGGGGRGGSKVDGEFGAAIVNVAEEGRAAAE